MADLNVNIGGNAEGAIAAVHAAQSAIDSLKGTTVEAHVKVTTSGAGGGIPGLSSEMEKLTRATNGASSASDAHVAKMAAAEAATRRQAGAMRELSEHTNNAQRSVERLGGNRGIEEQSKAAASLSKQVQSTNGHVETLNKALNQTGAGASQQSWEDILRARDALPKESPSFLNFSQRGVYGRALGPRVGAEGRAQGAAQILEARQAASAIDEVGKASDRANEPTKRFGRSAGSMFGMAERQFNELQNVGWQLSMVAGGMTAAAGGSAKLMQSTAGLGMNFQGLQKGIEQAAWSAARTHDLGMSGLDAHLRQTARTMVGELAPAMRASVGAVKAFEDAQMGAQGALGPQIEEFANTVTRNAPQIQQVMQAAGGAMLSLGTAAVQGLSNAAPAIEAFSSAITRNQGAVTSMVTGGVDAVTGLGAASANVLGNATGVTSALIPGGLGQKLAAGGVTTGTNVPFGISLSPRVLENLAASGPVGAAAAALATQMGMVDTGGAGGVAPGTDTGGLAPRGTPSAGQFSSTSAFQQAQRADRRQDAIDRGRAALDQKASPFPRVASPGLGAGAGAVGGLGGVAGLGPGSAVRGTDSLRQFQQALGQTQSAAQSFSGATGQAMSQVGQATQRGTQQATQVVRQVPPAIQSAAPAAVASGASFGAALGSGVASGTTRTVTSTDKVLRKHLQQIIDSASNDANQGGQSVGAAINQGTATGMTSTVQVVDKVIKKHVRNFVDDMMDALGIQSPSKVTAQMVGVPMGQGIGVGFTASVPGVSKALTTGLGQVSSGAVGVASDLGLKAGNVYGQSFVDGSVRQIQKSLTMAEGLPSGLGAGALLGLAATGLVQAGSGASTFKANPGASQLVSFAGGGQVMVQVNLDGEQLHQQMYDIADDRSVITVNTAMRKLANTGQAQRG